MTELQLKDPIEFAGISWQFGSAEKLIHEVPLFLDTQSTVYEKACGPRTHTLTDQDDAPLSFASLGTGQYWFSVHVESTIEADIGVHTVKISVSLQDHPSVASIIQSFDIEILCPASHTGRTRVVFD